MNKLTKGKRMCICQSYHCNAPFPCKLAGTAYKMGLRLMYKKEDIGICTAFKQMIQEGTL